MDVARILAAHKKKNGKIEIVGKVSIGTEDDLATYYTPGVSYVSLEIKKDKSKAYEYTSKANTIAIISDGTRILGLGNVGPEAGLAVMEGKSLLFKKFGGVDAVPICINESDEDTIVELAKRISPTFGGIVIEDIQSPKSFHVVERLGEGLSIPVFHDDQHGVAAVAVGGLMNALKLAGKSMKDARIVINGSGSAGVGIVKLLCYLKARNIYVLDTNGLIYKGREKGMNKIKEAIADMTNYDMRTGTLSEIAKGADVLIGVSAKGAFTGDLIRSMGKDPIVFALANPDPEISYADAKAAGAFIVGTGASNLPNQINNLKVFPGIMRGVLDVRATRINESMLYAAAKAVAASAGMGLSPERIVCGMEDPKGTYSMMANVAKEVAKAAIESNVAGAGISPSEVRKHALFLIKRYAKIEKRLSKL